MNTTAVTLKAMQKIPEEEFGTSPACNTGSQKALRKRRHMS